MRGANLENIMECQINSEFRNLVIQLNTKEEVEELKGILVHVDNSVLAYELLSALNNVSFTPMLGMFDGKLKKNGK